jgi:type IV pilus assembly protein PilZ
MDVQTTQVGPSVELRVNYKRLNTFFSDYIKSISRGATFIATQRPLPLGTHFVFVLGVPNLDAPLVVGGKVATVVTPETASAVAPAGMHIHLDYESALEEETLRSTVEALMRRELGETLANSLLAVH